MCPRRVLKAEEVLANANCDHCVLLKGAEGRRGVLRVSFSGGVGSPVSSLGPFRRPHVLKLTH